MAFPPLLPLLPLPPLLQNHPKIKNIPLKACLPPLSPSPHLPLLPLLPQASEATVKKCQGMRRILKTSQTNLFSPIQSATVKLSTISVAAAKLLTC
jgi:hypothetical protein